jgi:hypothetical protein
VAVAGDQAIIVHLDAATLSRPAVGETVRLGWPFAQQRIVSA